MKRAQRNFRPWPENNERLDKAAEHGVNVSEMINELIRDNFKSYLEKKAKKYSQFAASN